MFDRLLRFCMAALMAGSLGLSGRAYGLVISPDLEAVYIPSVGTGFQAVSLETTFTNPVVVCTYNLPTAADGEAAIRINAAVGNSFEVRLQPLNPPVPPLAPESDVYCLVAEETLPGDPPYSLPGGLQFEAHTVLSTDTSGPDIIFGDDFNGTGEDVTADIEGSYANPLVLGQVMTENDSGFSVFWSYNCLSRVFNPFQLNGQICVGKHTGQSNEFRADETLGFLVIETAAGNNNGIRYQALLGPDTVRGVDNGPPFNYAVNDDYTFGAATISGMDGGDGGFAVLFGDVPVDGGLLGLAIDEESASDGERSHTTEQVAAWVFAESDFPDAPSSYNAGDPPEHQVLAGFSVDSADAIFIGTSYTSEIVEVTDDSDVDDGAIVFPEIQIPSPGDTYAVEVPYSGTARLCGWIDFDINGQGGDGTFEIDERVCVDTDAGECTGGGTTGVCTLEFTIPADFVFDGTQDTWARFRIAEQTAGPNPVESPTGMVFTGEVEDYIIDANTLPVTLSQFESRQTASRLHVKWQTSSETFTVGFNIWGQVNDEWVQLNPSLILTRRLDSRVPRRYRRSVKIRDLDGPLQAVALTSVDFNGYEEGFGPFRIGEKYGVEFEFDPIPWSRIQAEYARTMSERGYILIDNRWRRETSARARRFASAAAEAELMAHIGVEADGMIRISHADLVAVGIDLSGIPTTDIALTWRGFPVHRVVTGSRQTFGDGSAILFYGEAPKGRDSLYIAENIYQLGVDTNLALDVENITRKPGNRPDTYLDTSTVEEDVAYANILPTGDPFHMGILVATGGNGADSDPFPVTVAGDIDTALPAIVEVHLAAISDPPAQDVDGIPGHDPDHAVEILVNGVPAVLDNGTFEGYGKWVVRGEIAPGGLQPGENEIVIRQLPTGYTQTELLALDSYAVHYPRPVLAADDRLEIGPVNGDVDGVEGFAVSGFSEIPASAYAFSPGVDSRPGNLLALRVRKLAAPGDTNTISFPVVSYPDTRYWVSTLEAMDEPSFIAPIVPQQDLLDQQGDYIVIGHGNFLPLPHQTGVGDHVLNEYVANRRVAGYDPLVVDYDQVVAQFGHGMNTPEAITNYLRAARERFDFGHVLLVGGDVFDYQDKLGTGAISFIPTSYGVTVERLQYTPSDALTMDLDGDEVSDVAHGRWPVRSYADLETIVGKTLDYADPVTGLYDDRTALLIAEEITLAEGYDFSAQMDRLNARLQSVRVAGDDPVAWDQEPGAVDRVDIQQIIDDPSIPPEQVVSTARQRIIDGINQEGGQALTIFGGHGAPYNWSFSSVMTPAIASNDLANSGAPTLMMPMACYTTYYNLIETNTLAHQLLFAGDRGAVGIHAAATLSSYSDNELLGSRVLDHQLQDGDTLGQAILKARQSSSSRDVQINWTLLGDPTVEIR